MTAEDIRRNEEVGFITSRRRFCVAEDGAFIQSVGIKKPVPESRNPVKQRVAENRAFYPQNDPFKLIYSPVIVFIHCIINGLSRVIQVRP